MTKSNTDQVEKKTALKILREAANLTQSQVARHLSKDVSTIRRWESGYEPSLTHDEWLKLCDLLKKNFYDLPRFLSEPPEQSSDSPKEKN
jgi:transcriptional regulator with XRE-family HTH domain